MFVLDIKTMYIFAIVVNQMIPFSFVNKFRFVS
jgi:hypothetical protein